MPSFSSTLSTKLLTRFRYLDSTRIKVETLFSSGLLSQRDADRVYEGLFLSINTSFEQFLENLFIGLLVNGVGLQTSRRDIIPRITVNSYRIAREIVFGPTHKYINWIPYENTINLAQVYFQGGRPFSDLNASQIQTLRKCHIIRDAIAHKSRHSNEKFKNSIIGGANIPIKERNPTGYLRGVFRTNPPQSRHENFSSELAFIVNILAR